MYTRRKCIYRDADTAGVEPLGTNMKTAGFEKEMEEHMGSIGPNAGTEV